jgi:hypothetical protein
MAVGWNIRTTRINPVGGLDLQGCFAVRVPDKSAAIALVQSKMPGAKVWADSEASGDFLDAHDVDPGAVLALVEGS